MTIIHVCDGWEPTNGAANIARLLAGEQESGGATVSYRRWVPIRELRAADEVWIHCGWMPCLWWAALWAKRAVWVPEACYDPIRLRFHGWKKRLAGPIERFCLRRCAKIVATCKAEAEWVRAYLGRRCPEIEVTDVRRFFGLTVERRRVATRREDSSLHVLYLGRRHPLKGLKYLEQAIDASGLHIDFRAESDLHGAEKEAAWAWCDVLVLPTLSDNLGLVVAEALAHGKPVITTDGAPAWEDEPREDAEGNPRLIYLRGYRNGSDATRVQLLKDALNLFR